MATLRSYLISSTYEWIVSHNFTPYLLVDALTDGVIVPEEHIQDGRILLNASPSATQNIEISTNSIQFDVTFSGTPWHIVLPIESLLAIYAQETSQGLFSQPQDPTLLVNEGEEDQLDPDPKSSESTASDDSQKKAKKLGFKVIK